MKVFSKTTIYGIRALMYMLMKKDTAPYVNIREIAEQLDISFHFLTKILQTLTQAGILKSYRGPAGGIAFDKDEDYITLIEIVNVLEGDTFFDQCMLGLPGCGVEEPCPAHEFWKEYKALLKNKFEQTTLPELQQLGGRIGLEMVT